MKRHYVDDGFRAKGTTACGVRLFVGLRGVHTSGTNAWTTEDMDEVTCQRCIRSWNRFVREESK